MNRMHGELLAPTSCGRVLCAFPDGLELLSLCFGKHREGVESKQRLASQHEEKLCCDTAWILGKAPSLKR